MEHLISRAQRAGSTFFDPATIKAFHSRILPGTLVRLDLNTYRFVTSEPDFTGRADRRYTVREVLFYADPPRDDDEEQRPETDRVRHETVGEYRGHATRTMALAHLRDAV